MPLPGLQRSAQPAASMAPARAAATEGRERPASLNLQEQQQGVRPRRDLPNLESSSDCIRRLFAVLSRPNFRLAPREPRPPRGRINLINLNSLNSLFADRTVCAQPFLPL